MILSVLLSPALVSGLMVVRAKNPVHSVSFPIPVFRDTSGLLLLLGFDFFAMIFPVVHMNFFTIGIFSREAGRLRVGKSISALALSGISRLLFVFIFLFLKPLVRLIYGFFYIWVWSKVLGSWSLEGLAGFPLAFHSNSMESSWKESSFEINVLLESSSGAEAALSDVQAQVEAQAQAQAQAQIAHLEAELFARIRLLEAELAHGLPPQLNAGDYARLVQENLAGAVSIPHYWRTLQNELFEVQIMQLKASLQERLFNTLIAEPRIDQILNQSPYKDIRGEAYDFIEQQVEPVNSMRTLFQKTLLETTLHHFINDLQERGRESFLYKDFYSFFMGQ